MKCFGNMHKIIDTILDEKQRIRNIKLYNFLYRFGANKTLDFLRIILKMEKFNNNLLCNIEKLNV